MSLPQQKIVEWSPPLEVSLQLSHHSRPSNPQDNPFTQNSDHKSQIEPQFIEVNINSAQIKSNAESSSFKTTKSLIQSPISYSQSQDQSTLAGVGGGSIATNQSEKRTKQLAQIRKESKFEMPNYNNFTSIHTEENTHYEQIGNLKEQVSELEADLKSEVERNKVLEQFKQISETLALEGANLARDSALLRQENAHLREIIEELKRQKEEPHMCNGDCPVAIQLFSEFKELKERADQFSSRLPNAANRKVDQLFINPPDYLQPQQSNLLSPNNSEAERMYGEKELKRYLLESLKEQDLEDSSVEMKQLAAGAEESNLISFDKTLEVYAQQMRKNIEKLHLYENQIKELNMNQNSKVKQYQETNSLLSHELNLIREQNNSLRSDNHLIVSQFDLLKKEFSHITNEFDRFKQSTSSRIQGIDSFYAASNTHIRTDRIEQTNGQSDRVKQNQMNSQRQIEQVSHFLSNFQSENQQVEEHHLQHRYSELASYVQVIENALRESESSRCVLIETLNNLEQNPQVLYQ